MTPKQIRRQKKPKKHRLYSESALKDAVNAIRSKALTVGKAAKLYNVPKSTLWDNIKAKSNGFLPIGRKMLLDDTEEASLAIYMRWCEERNIPFTYQRLKAFVGQLVKKKASGNNCTQTVSQTWCQEFLQRHGFSSKARHIESSRTVNIAAATSDNIVHYFSMLEKEIQDLNLSTEPQSIWNCDKKGWSMFPPSLEAISNSCHLNESCRKEIEQFLKREEPGISSSHTEGTTSADEPGTSICWDEDQNTTANNLPHDTSTASPAAHNIELCGECGREISNPCTSCIQRERKRTNVLYRADVIPENLIDSLEPPKVEVPMGKGKTPLIKPNLVTGQEIFENLSTRKKLQHEKLKRKELKEKPNTKSSKSNRKSEHRNTEDIHPPTKRKSKQKRQASNRQTCSRTSNRERSHINYNALNEGRIESAIVEVCASCKLPAADDDETLNVIWYGCDYCPRWWHRHCLSGKIQTNADLSTMDQDIKFRCPACPEEPTCCVCLQLVSNKEAAQCHLCLAQYHPMCLPFEQQQECSVFLQLGKDWYCNRCEEENE